MADSCYRYVLDVLERTRPVVKALSERYKLVLVSNFYGNIQTILKDFGLFDFFADIIESSVVGVRKPDPAIYRLGVEAWGCQRECAGSRRFLLQGRGTRKNRGLQDGLAER